MFLFFSISSLLNLLSSAFALTTAVRMFWQNPHQWSSHYSLYHLVPVLGQLSTLQLPPHPPPWLQMSCERPCWLRDSTNLPTLCYYTTTLFPAALTWSQSLSHAHILSLCLALSDRPFSWDSLNLLRFQFHPSTLLLLVFLLMLQIVSSWYYALSWFQRPPVCS